ncbi:MAG TPA: GH116 family glycosyl hydrolase [Verrucomicrobiae bacterium]|jgi:uncharacterized protein (DUF608 family)|nr:GH116 family glycosyl hydrolase [Verrucomicrobiae bacterium]
MNRRRFSEILLGSLGMGPALLNCAAQGAGESPGSGAAANPQTLDRRGRLFPIDLPGNQWRSFPSAGFAKPACGLVYRRKERPQNGMPLGGMGTGRLDLKTNATLGFCTIFNSTVPQRGPLDIPFLGMSVGDQLWLMGQPHTTYGEYMYSGLQTPTEIHYWGHYPVADMEMDMPGSPVNVAVRSWAPFLPGDAAASNTPGAVFNVHLRNATQERQTGRLVFSFPGPTQAEAQVGPDSPREKAPFIPYGHAWVPVAKEKIHAQRKTVRGDFSGLVVTSHQGVGYALGVAGNAEIIAGAGLHDPESPYKTGQTWGKIATELPTAAADDFSGSIAIKFELAPGEEKVIPIVLAWYAPNWIGEGSHTFTQMYTTRFADVLAVAELLCRKREEWLQRILAWQEVVYGAVEHPIWLRESLINILYLFPVNSFWAAARPPVGPWCRPEDGLFGLLDGIVEDPAMEPIPDTFYANAPLVYFFPDLALSTLRAYKAYQFASGAAVWIWGGVVGAATGGYEMTAGTEMAIPTPGYQTTTNGPCYVDMVDRYLQRTGDPKVLTEFYDSIKRNTIYTMSLHSADGGDGIISVPQGNVDPMNPAGPPGFHLEWFEGILWFGMTSHVGGIHLANLKMTERLAQKAGDKEFAQQCRNWFKEGSQSMEEKMWTGAYYLAYFDPKLQKKSDNVFAYQLDGEWMTRYHDCGGVFRPERVKTALASIRKACIDRWAYGAVNAARPDGSLAHDVGYGPNAFFVPEVYMLAMTYIYAGEHEFGVELARRCVTALNVENLLTWDQPNLLRADTGDMLFGSHYVQNMMLWALPAAMKSQGIGAFCAPGGLVDQILRAAKS